MNKQDIIKIRNEFYDSLPTGEVEAFDLLTAIKNHLAKLDEFAERLSDGWVKVEDGLPEDGQWCMVYATDMQEFFDNRIEVFQFKNINWGRWPFVTHWRTLPPNPEKE